MIDQEVSASAARFFGHVCGVIAVAMAALSGWAVWRAGNGIADGRFSIGFGVLVALCLVVTALFFRWAGVLTGHWATHGRLAVPPSVYATFGVLCAGVAAVGFYLLCTQALSLWAALKLAGSVIGGATFAYWCWLLSKRRR